MHLIQRIEANWEKIATAVAQQSQRDRNVEHYRTLDNDELRKRAQDVAQNLGYWLTTENSGAVVERYRALGRRRYHEGFPLSEVVYKLQLIERKITEYAQDQNAATTALEIYGELEMLRALRRFFDLAIHGLVSGYEQAARNTGTWQSDGKPVLQETA
ncbi:MAG TPA: hypothetical protein DEH78_19335 [Solibacterales bacterium]|nr:hypothetical protein [Bryobacterales bacterium]